MKKIRYGLILLSMLLSLATTATAELSFSIGIPNVRVGINQPIYPQLVMVPNTPVYYAPQVDGNYFFYDGMYWIYQDDDWYASSWYNGPWGYVEPEIVPLYVLQIPVRYYRQPPEYFRGWRRDAPPQWGHHWGRHWEDQRRGWDRRQPQSARAPLPVYQQQYNGNHYPRMEQQQQLRDQHYRYQPREQKVREHYIQKVDYRAPISAKQRRYEQQEQRKQEQQERSYQDRGESQNHKKNHDQNKKYDERGQGRDD